MGLMQSLADKLPSSIQELLMPRAARLLTRAGELLLAGRSAEAIALFMEDADITPDLYNDRHRLGDRLRQRVAGENPNIAALYIKGLAWALWKADRSKDALAVVEADFQVEPVDYSEPGRLAARLRARLSPLEPEIAVQHIQFFSEILGMVDREVERLAIWEADLGLERGEEKVNILKAMRHRIAGLRDPETSLIYVFGLFGSLTASGRVEEASFVLSQHLGIDETDYLNPQQLLAKIPFNLEPLDNVAAAVIVSLAATQLSQERSILPLLEALLVLGPDSYHDPVELAARLKTRLDSLLPGWVWNLTGLLMIALIMEDRDRDALVVGQAAARFSVGEEPEALQLGRMLREHRDALSEERLLFFVGMLSTTLLGMEQFQEALAVLEGFADLRPEDYRSTAALEDRLSLPLERWQVSLSGGFLSSLLRALRAAGEEEKAALLVDVYVARFGPRSVFEGLDFVPGLLQFYASWLEYFGHAPERRPLMLCQIFVDYLRQKLGFHGVQLKDRVDFISDTADLRRRVIEIGLFWAEQESATERARSIALDVLLWDAELMQRLLIERFLLQPIVEIPRGSQPSRNWPWRPESKPDSESYLPDVTFTRTMKGAIEEDLDASPSSREASGAAAQLQADRPDLFRRAREILLQGVDAGRMAETVGTEGLLLRATFGTLGQLLWFAVRSDGRNVDLVAKGGGAAGDLDRLRWAAARHDFRMALTRFLNRNERLRGVVVTVLGDVGQVLAELLGQLGSPVRRESLIEQLTRISNYYFARDRRNRETLLRLLGPVLGPLHSPPGLMSREDWTRNTVEQIQGLQDLLSARPPENLQMTLDQITSDYIEEVGRIWNLEGLAAALSPEVDLIVQLDDALHTVPIAHVPVAGERLFRQVRSIRSSFALLMTSLQLEAEQEFHRDQGQPGRLLSVSHFKEGDEARKGALWLQHGFSVLGKNYRCETYGAAENPVGSVGLLRTALEDPHGWRVLAICGHGDLYRSGIQLPVNDAETDGGSVGLWDGSGCDLSHVDWLWMVSCSIGRLSANGDRDVEGFCVRLALHRARSVAAFRWPVHSIEAVALVNESVRLYLKGLQDGKGTNVRYLRARALNDARKSFFGDGTHPPLYPHVGLNTAAACELFGLG